MARIKQPYFSSGKKFSCISLTLFENIHKYIKEHQLISVHGVLRAFWEDPAHKGGWTFVGEETEYLQNRRKEQKPGLRLEQNREWHPWWNLSKIPAGCPGTLPGPMLANTFPNVLDGARGKLLQQSGTELLALIKVGEERKDLRQISTSDVAWQWPSMNNAIGKKNNNNKKD